MNSCLLGEAEQCSRRINLLLLRLDLLLLLEGLEQEHPSLRLLRKVPGVHVDWSRMISEDVLHAEGAVLFRGERGGGGLAVPSHPARRRDGVPLLLKADTVVADTELCGGSRSGNARACLTSGPLVLLLARGSEWGPASARRGRALAPRSLTRWRRPRRGRPAPQRRGILGLFRPRAPGDGPARH